MRELKKQDMIDILYGCAVLGTGGGGPLEEGLAMMQKHFDNDEVLSSSVWMNCPMMNMW